MRLTMAAIWPTWGFSVSIHSRSAPFCRLVMQSRTTRSSPVPGLNWNRPEARRFGRTNWPFCLITTSPLLMSSAFSITSPSIKLLYWSPRSPGSLVTAIFWVRPAPSDDAVINAQLKERQAHSIDLGQEVGVRNGHFAVLVATLLFVRHLVFQL